MGLFWFKERDEHGEKYRDKEDFLRRGRKSDEDVLVLDTRSSVYHLCNSCFTGDCMRISRKDAENRGYHLCKNCERHYLQYYRGNPYDLKFE